MTIARGTGRFLGSAVTTKHAEEVVMAKISEVFRRRMETAFKSAEEALKELDYALLYVAASEPDLPADIQETVRGMREEMKGQVRRLDRFFEEKRKCRKS